MYLFSNITLDPIIISKKKIIKLAQNFTIILVSLLEIKNGRNKIPKNKIEK
tara:strand:- start:488 stop:640 length:153 start_codon:yes stop_codon:yes gene_type:complete